MTDQTLFERRLEWYRSGILTRPENIRILSSEGNINGLLMNYGGWCEDHVMVGLLQWRRGGDPRPDFAAGLDAIAQGLAEASKAKASVRDIDRLRLDIALPIAVLMNRTLPVPTELRPSEHELPDVAASYLLGEALVDRPYLRRLPTVMTALNSKKRQMLAALSFQTYFDILENTGDHTIINQLATQADTLYLRRKKDVFYSRGSVILAGGEDNALLLDWQLSAVLKKVGFEGESIHRWRWN